MFGIRWPWVVWREKREAKRERDAQFKQAQAAQYAAAQEMKAAIRASKERIRQDEHASYMEKLAAMRDIERKRQAEALAKYHSNVVSDMQHQRTFGSGTRQAAASSPPPASAKIASRRDGNRTAASDPGPAHRTSHTAWDDVPANQTWPWSAHAATPCHSKTSDSHTGSSSHDSHSCDSGGSDSGGGGGGGD